MTHQFVSRQPQLEDYWRGIILFGRNVASYKFALAKALLDLKPQAGELLKMSEVAPAFALHVATHLKLADKQGTSRSSTFLDSCRQFNKGELNRDDLIEQTLKYGFNNVIDAFHVVGRGEIDKRFYVDERIKNGGIRITDEFSKLSERDQFVSLGAEVEARWRLVETAWELGINRGLVTVDYDTESEALFALDNLRRRKPVTSSRDALNGYQKGQCFYCYSEILSDEDRESFPEVDHFFPHSLKQVGFGAVIDGVWNLVLACKECNRGTGGKFDRVPTIKLLKRLDKRNEFLISSHHPLRETLMEQTGSTAGERRVFLNDFHDRARASLIHTWEPEEVAMPRF